MIEYDQHWRIYLADACSIHEEHWRAPPAPEMAEPRRGDAPLMKPQYQAIVAPKNWWGEWHDSFASYWTR